jgi:hypothetical protein
MVCNSPEPRLSRWEPNALVSEPFALHCKIPGLYSSEKLVVPNKGDVSSRNSPRIPRPVSAS